MNKNRNYGLDLLRIMSMIGIIGLHIYNNGGFLNSLDSNSFFYPIALIIFSFFYTSVNIFAMLSGYLYIEKKDIKSKNLFNLIGTVVFFCIMITVVFYGFNLFDIRTLGLKTMISSLCPVLFDRYWYITSYCLLFILIPFINHFLHSLSKKRFQLLLFILFILLSVIPSVTLKVDFFKLNFGYSPFWLMYCYMIGSYLKMYSTLNNKKKIILSLIISIIASSFINYLIRMSTLYFFGKMMFTDSFINYISPFNICSAVCLILIFQQIIIKKELFINIVKYFSATSFSVYIIHCHILIFDFIIKDSFKYIYEMNPVFNLILIFLSIFCIYIICSFLDTLKNMIFKILKINSIFEYLGIKIDKLLKEE